jgi:hypothetical protein
MPSLAFDEIVFHHDFVAPIGRLVRNGLIGLALVLAVLWLVRLLQPDYHPHAATRASMTLQAEAWRERDRIGVAHIARNHPCHYIRGPESSDLKVGLHVVVEVVSRTKDSGSKRTSVGANCSRPRLLQKAAKQPGPALAASPVRPVTR